MDGQVDLYDNALLGILQNEGQVYPFLEAIFGFLYRRTDFYRSREKNDGKLGFPEGAAQAMTLKAFKKFQHQATQDEKQRASAAEAICNDPPNIEVIAETEDFKPQSADPESELPTSAPIKPCKIASTDVDCYNGAVCENYSWSQTIRDLDVRVKVPKEVSKAKAVKVDMSCNRLNVQLARDGVWETVVNGDLSWRINHNDSMWTLVPSECVNINLEKVEERWWDSLLVHESKIDIQDIDSCRPMEDLDEEEQSVVDKLMFDEQQKLLGKPTSEQMKVENLLREAWDKEGSPFQGQPFDPSVVNITNPANFPNLG